MSSSAPPEIVLFLHIAKTAGSSVRALLAGRFEPDQIAEPRPPGNLERENRRYLAGETSIPPPWEGHDSNTVFEEYLSTLSSDRLDRLRLVQGHFWYGVHEVLPRPAAYVTVLRDPIERVLSLHAHRVRHHGVPASLEEYLREGRDFNVSNGQVRRLAGAPTRDPRSLPLTDADVERAKRHLREIRVVGVTERFDEFVVLLGSAFGWHDLTAPALNRTPGRPRADDVDASTIEALRELNRGDQALYDYAKELIAERTAPDRARIDAEIRRLRSRTARREAASRATERVTKKLRGARVKLGRALRTGGTAGGT